MHQLKTYGLLIPFSFPSAEKKGIRIPENKIIILIVIIPSLKKKKGIGEEIKEKKQEMLEVMGNIREKYKDGLENLA